MARRNAPHLPPLLVLALVAPATAQDGAGLPFLPKFEEEGSLMEDLPPSEEWDELVEPWAERGWEPGLLLISDTSLPLIGVRPRRRATRTLFDVSLGIDLDTVAGIRGTTVFAEAYALRGRDASLDVGDAQVFSNIDGPTLTQLAELWIQHGSRDGTVRVKLGKSDANSEFALVHAGLEFLHSSAGFSPTIFPFPSYPEPAVGLGLFLAPSPTTRVGLGAFNAQDGGTVSGRRGLSASFDEVFWIAQLDRTWGDGAGRFAAGGWHHTGSFIRNDGANDEGAEGTYALLEQRLWGEPDGPGVTGFLQWGATGGRVSPVEGHQAAGLLVTGLVQDVRAWQTGLYASRAELRGVPGTAPGDELAVELVQKIPLTPHISLKPDLQWIHDPSGVPQARDVWVGTLRLEVVL